MQIPTTDKSKNPLKIFKRFIISPDEITPRMLLFFPAAVIQLIASALSGIGYSLNSGSCWLSGMIMWVVWFFFMSLIISPQTDVLLQQHYRFIRRGAIIIFTSVFIFGIGESIVLGLFTPWFLDNGVDNAADKIVEQLDDGFQYNDGTALCQQAAENLLAGKEPYTNANLVTAMVKFEGALDRVTPLKVGRFANVFPYPTKEEILQIWDSALQNPSQTPPEMVSGVCYPSGSFLVLAPFFAAGIKDIRIIYFILALAAMIYTAWRIKGNRRLIFIGVALISLELWNTLIMGETGIIIFPMLLIAWITIGRNNLVSAIFMGLAVATKQTAWFFFPFYLILLWRTAGPKVTIKWIGIAAAVFVAMNGYFIAKAPALWMQSVMSPMTEPMFPMGVGFVSLITGGFVSIDTALPFAVAEVVVLIGAALWYYKYCKKYPDAGPILAIMPLFFAWRSLWTYFFYVGIIVLAGILMRAQEDSLVQAKVKAKSG